MRRLILIVVLFFSVAEVWANEDVRLRELTRAIDSLGSYEVGFEMEVNAERLDFSGRYIVDGDRYRLESPGQVIMGDAQVRYTIDSLNREVVVERVGDGVPMIISNPARAFMMLDQFFASSLKFTGADYYTLWLRPKERDPILRVAELQLSHATHLPISVLYTSHEGDRIGLYFHSVTSIEGGVLMEFSQALYPSGYEVIDFR